MEQDSARTLKWHKDVWLTVLRFQFRRNLQIARRMLDRDGKKIGFTADLAIFYILLVNTGRFIYENLVPLTATCALKASFHFILWSHSSLQVAPISIGVFSLASQDQDDTMERAWRNPVTCSLIVTGIGSRAFGIGIQFLLVHFDLAFLLQALLQAFRVELEYL